MSILLALALSSAPVEARPGTIVPRIESPVPPGKVTLHNLGSVVAALQKEGYRAMLVTEGSKRHIESASNGAKFYVYPQSCSDKGLCEDLLFRSSYTKHKERPITIEEINTFNRDARWARAYLDKDGDPTIEMDVLFTDQLVDEKMFNEAVQLWSKQMGVFHTAIRF